MPSHKKTSQLDNYFFQIQEVILNKQDWVSGLLPASTAITVHGNYTDAWVRDNVYSILAVWGLALAYRRTEANNGRAYLLEQSTVKLMRGLLTAMMRQADKVEKFKHTQNPIDALHAKYNTRTGEAVVGDYDWGHLQLDATSLFLLTLAQMTASGLRIVFTLNEVNFVQNLVHYISRTYRTPDYGIWERGDKINHGIAELNASSIGMAKAALEAMSGFNLFGKDGGQASVMHVVSDDIARTRITLESLLPHESVSKEVDSALLSITGYPAFAVNDPRLRKKTEALVVEKLEGRYGCKRFLLDGHQTAIEDVHRLHYDPQELKQFADIECEWPLFFCYLMLNHTFAGNTAAAKHYRKKLDALRVERHGQQLLPELYIVPEQSIPAEKAQPNSQQRIANDNIPLVWAQSLFVLGCLLQDGLLTTDDIDPIGRHKRLHPSQPHRLHVALLAQDTEVQAILKSCGIRAQTLAETSPIQIREADELAQAYVQVGRNDRIGLTGRPLRQLRSLATSKMYVLAGERLVFLPQCLNQKSFYLAMDNHLLIKRLRSEFQYINRHWEKSGNPLLVIMIRKNMLASHNRQVLIDFLKELDTGLCGDVPLRTGKLTDFADICNYEKIDYLHDFYFSKTHGLDPERPCSFALPVDKSANRPLPDLLLNQWEIGGDAELLVELADNPNLFAQLEALSLLANRHGLDYLVEQVTSTTAFTIRDLLEEVYQRAGDQHVWYVVRRCAGLLGKYDINLEQATTDILVRQHYLTVGKAYSGKATLKRPVDSTEILAAISHYNDHDASQIVMMQELILYLGLFIKSRPELFADMQTIRVGHILQLVLARHQRKTGDSLDKAFNHVMSLPPHLVANKVLETLENFSNTETQLQQVQELKIDSSYGHVQAIRFAESINPTDRADDQDWYAWREHQGSLGRENESFFTDVWNILHHCEGLTIGEKINSKRRLDSNTVLAQMTSGEQSFKLSVNHLLNKIQAPVYRQLTVEALKSVAAFFEKNPIKIDGSIIMDILIGRAVRLNWLQAHPEAEDNYDQQAPLAWQSFYQIPPHQAANCILDALLLLLNNNTRVEEPYE